MANYLGRAWAYADPHFASTFASLSQIQSVPAYLGVLNSFASGAISGQGTNMALSLIHI